MDREEVLQLIRDEISHAALSNMPDYGGYSTDHDKRYFVKFTDSSDSIVFLSCGGIEIGKEKPGTIGNFRLWIVDGKLETQISTATGWADYDYLERLG